MCSMSLDVSGLGFWATLRVEGFRVFYCYIHLRTHTPSCQTETVLFPACDMSITVEVGLLSGKTAKVNASLDEDLAALQLRAQTALGVGRGRLLDSSGRVLDACTPIKTSSVHHGDSLTLLTSRAQVCGTYNAFAVILGDGSVLTWGDARFGGDSSAVQGQLKGCAANPSN